MTVRIVLLVMLSCLLAVFSIAGEPAVSVLYPKDRSVAGGKVNIVLDPGADWSGVPFFQVTVGKTEYPLVDTSSGKHAFQGVDLEPGINTITVKTLAPAADKEKKDKQPQYREVSSRTITVFSMVELFTGRTAPEGYAPALFHSRENEAPCGGCHSLEAKADSPRPKKPEDAVCYACHRGVPTGRHIHGPAAVWDCLSCHDPEIYPVKYQFTAEDPWKVSKTVQSVVPVVFSIPSDALFTPNTAALDAKFMKKVKAKGKKQRTTWDLDKLREPFGPVLEHVRLNPGDRVRVEAHTDNTPLPKPKGKQAKGFKDNLALTKARAAAVAALLKQYGVTGKNRVAAVGMGDALPKLSNTTKENRALNNRIEIVLYPADVKVANSAKLPVLKDRDRVVVSLSYAHGPAVKKLRVVEKVPPGSQYQKGTGFFAGRAKEPKIRGNELVWELGNMGQSFSEMFSYVIRKGKKSSPLSSVVAVSYDTFAGHQVAREFDPVKPAKRSHTVPEACMKCHPDALSGKYRHGPADGGYCNLCHDPHGSPYSAWLRKPSWDLCTTCHVEMASGVHVLAGFVKGTTHPTRIKRDPARPGKRLSCASCHEPHGAANEYLFAFEAKTRYELCGVCHRKK